MITYEHMKYLTAFSRCKTLSAVAQEFNISQPTITRSMKSIEEEFGVPLFDRTKNSISLNPNGELAAQEAQMILHQYDAMLHRVREYYRASYTVAIGTAAAVPVPGIIERISALYPTSTISSELKKPKELIEGLQMGAYQLVILPYKPKEEGLSYIKVGEEHLMFYLPKNHKFARRKSLPMAEMNGENMLLFSKIGFWHDITVEKMPDSRFLMQSERYSMEELIANSVLPCFVTDLTIRLHNNLNESRVAVPITDSEVNVEYYLVCKKENKNKYSSLFSG